MSRVRLSPQDSKGANSLHDSNGLIQRDSSLLERYRRNWTWRHRTFEELQDHAYMKEILDIHKENKVSLEDAANEGAEDDLANDEPEDTLRKISS